MNSISEKPIVVKPIIFSGEMVRAILDGSKTQTRRLIKLPGWSTGNWNDFEPDDSGGLPMAICKETGCLAEIQSPYAGPGDRLWVREAFWIEHDSGMYMDRVIDCGITLAEDTWAKVWYCATDNDPRDLTLPPSFYSKHSSIYMPRWASRILLEIVDIWHEQLWVASLDDIKAEGVDPLAWGKSRNDGYAYVQAWKKLWNSIHSKPGDRYEANPWVWRIEFRLMRGSDE